MGREEVGGQEPGSQWKMRAMHHRPGVSIA
jgi:hypothetical protein